MKDYIVIDISGKQYIVGEGDEILVDKVKSELNPRVLLQVERDKVRIGKPDLAKVKVGLKVVEESVKGEKVVVSKYKAKSRYRRKKGFRPLYTRLLVEKIGG